MAQAQRYHLAAGNLVEKVRQIVSTRDSSRAFKVSSRRNKTGALEYSFFGYSLGHVNEDSVNFETCLEFENEALNAGNIPKMCEVSGEALTLVPHGFVLCYGTQHDIESLVEKSNPEANCQVISIPAPTFKKSDVVDLMEMRRNIDDCVENAVAGKILQHKVDTFDCHRLYDAITSISQWPSSTFLYALLEFAHKFPRVSIPGGKRRLGESSLECAVRELKEEAGVSIEISKHATSTFILESKARIYYVNVSNSKIPDIEI